MENSIQKVENWKIIDGYQTYEVSITGLVRSSNYKTQRILKASISNEGYLMIKLSKNGILKNLTIHRIVASHFVSNPDNKSYVNHINGIKTDNRAENLEWNSPKENIHHSWKNGLSQSLKGEKHHQSKLTKSQVLEIRNSSLKQKDLAVIYGISKTVISDIKNNKLWKHL